MLKLIFVLKKTFSKFRSALAPAGPSLKMSTRHFINARSLSGITRPGSLGIISAISSYELQVQNDEF